MINTVYIGYDLREDEAYRACVSSIRANSGNDIRIVKLDIHLLYDLGLYHRIPYWDKMNGMNSYVDIGDNKPFSTEFAFSRFLVPILQVRQGWALFCDCDFIFTENIKELSKYKDNQYAVRVVQHEHNPKEVIKMDGMQQQQYFRKNWSSLILWNCEHDSHSMLDVDTVSRASGSWLHGFRWLHDNEIGGLPADWNFLVGYDKPDGMPRGIHYTSGVPTMPGYQNCDYAEEYYKYVNNRHSKR